MAARWSAWGPVKRADDIQTRAENGQEMVSMSRPVNQTDDVHSEGKNWLRDGQYGVFQ